MLDAVQLEKQGVPAAAICTDAFDGSAHEVAEAHGIPWYPFAVIPHPIGPKTEDELRALAGDVVDRVDWLLSPEASEANAQDN